MNIHKQTIKCRKIYRTWMVWESVDHVYPDARQSFKSLLICIMFGSVVAANITVPRDSCNAGMLHEFAS